MKKLLLVKSMHAHIHVLTRYSDQDVVISVVKRFGRFTISSTVCIMYIHVIHA